MLISETERGQNMFDSLQMSRGKAGIYGAENVWGWGLVKPKGDMFDS